VVKYLQDRRYGFVKADSDSGDGGKDCFFHLKAWASELSPAPGMRVRLIPETEAATGRQRARIVRPIERGVGLPNSIFRSTPSAGT